MQRLFEELVIGDIGPVVAEYTTAAVWSPLERLQWMTCWGYWIGSDILVGYGSVLGLYAVGTVAEEAVGTARSLSHL